MSNLGSTLNTNIFVKFNLTNVHSVICHRFNTFIVAFFNQIIIHSHIRAQKLTNSKLKS